MKFTIAQDHYNLLTHSQGYSTHSLMDLSYDILQAKPQLRQLFAASQLGGLGSFPCHAIWDLWWTAASPNTLVFHSQYPTSALLIHSYTSMIYNLSNTDHH